MNNYFCPLPWLHSFIMNNGYISICCHSGQGPNKGILYKNNGVKYNIKNGDSINKSRNSELIKEVRKSILNNKWHPECIRCKKEFNLNLENRPKYELEEWGRILSKNKALTLTNSDGSINLKDFPIHYYDIRFGNKCNLKCRICSPNGSNFWNKDYNIIWENKYKIEKHYDWYKNKKFWNHIEKNLKYINKIDLSGGEPLIIQQHWDFLKYCVTKNYAKNITLNYNTNLFFLPKDISIWKQFKKIQLGVSIDSLFEKNDYIRYPSKWDNLIKNFNKIKSIKTINSRISTTISIYNILDLPDLLNFFKVERILIHPLHTPKYLNCKSFPKEIKEKIKILLEDKIKTMNIKIQNEVNKYILFMFQEDESIHFKNFFIFNNKVDNLWGVKMKNYLPELYELIKEGK